MSDERVENTRPASPNELAEPNEPAPCDPMLDDATQDRPVTNERLVRLMQANTDTLAQLVDDIATLRGAVHERFESTAPSYERQPGAVEQDADAQHPSLQQTIEDLQTEVANWSSKAAEAEARVARLQEAASRSAAKISDLEQQNEDLAAKVASSNVRRSVTSEHSSSSDALSWEDRKALILRQMEEDSFDASEFIEKLNVPESSQDDGDDQPLDPISYVQQLHSDLKRREEELQRREDEIGELRCLLEQQSGTREGGVAIGAAAIAEMVDADELVREERERLQQLQAQWEEKFRQSEIEASLERAKLSRERQELAKKTEQLEEQLEHLRRESRQVVAEGSGTSRRWRAKLGLTEDDE